jgi:DNA-binding MarR family transcriptional regulator
MNYHSTVMAKLESGLCEINNIFSPDYHRKKVEQHGIMVCRFVSGIKSFTLTSATGDVFGITGYTPEEFQNKDIIKLLKLSPTQIQQMVTRLETAGFCAKNTTFTRKDGSLVKVSSIIKKVADNTYEEITVLSDSFVDL